tara:strand:- start:138 stop:398 length:261 start_codon:yes stop_codon:yes gene_type:complete
MKSEHQEDYNLSYQLTEEMLKDLAHKDFSSGAVISGALTAVLYRLMLGSQDPQTVLGTIAGAMGHAAIRMEIGEEIFKDGPSDEVH